MSGPAFAVGSIVVFQVADLDRYTRDRKIPGRVMLEVRLLHDAGYHRDVWYEWPVAGAAEEAEAR